MEFKSQPCTDINQSRKLLKLGLKKETADCGHFYREECEDWETIILDNGWQSDWDVTDKEIPAWSLHRLMEIAYKGDILGCVALNFHERNIGAYYEQVIKVIEYLIGIKEFNKDYLEDKQ